MLASLFKPRLASMPPARARRPSPSANASFHTPSVPRLGLLARRARASISRQDALAAPRLAAAELFDELVAAMRTERGVHAESVLTALAALAGHACQAAVRAEFIERRGWVERQTFVVVETPDGSSYYLGEPIDRGLIDDRLSIWHLACRAARQLGVEALPDLDELGRHVASTFGTPEFGWPRSPSGHEPGRTPIAYLRALWVPFHRIVDRHCERASDWPVAAGLALQQAMVLTAQALEPAMALRLVMETAMPMARVRLVLTALDGTTLAPPAR